MNVVDSSGWIEYLQDTPRADLFAAAIEDRRHLLVPSIALFEVHNVLSCSLDEAIVTQCLDVMRLSRVLDLTDARAIAASKTSRHHKLAMADGAMGRCTAWHASLTPSSGRKTSTIKACRASAIAPSQVRLCRNNSNCRSIGSAVASPRRELAPSAVSRLGASRSDDGIPHAYSIQITRFLPSCFAL